MSDYLKQNLDHLRRLNPDLAERVEKAVCPEGARVMDARNGQPTLIVNGITFHSRIDPGAEGVKMAASALEAAGRAGKTPGFFGLGLGWHVLALAEQSEELVVVEPDPGMIRLALTCLDFGPRLSRIRLVLTTADLASPEGLVLTPHPPTVRVHQAAFREWTRFFEQGMETAAETVASLSARIGHLPGAPLLLSELDLQDRLALDDLVRLASKSELPPTETEIYILLLKELQL